MEVLLNKKIIAVSNYKITKETEKFISEYRHIIRFNSGSNPSVLKQYEFYNQRTDVSVLSGWQEGDFGTIDGFCNQKILFSRPKCANNILYNFKNICVKQQFENNLKNVNVKSIDYMPLQIFYNFYNEYDYDNPTTGLITLYYIKKILNFPIDCLNFFIDDKLYNTFLKNSPKETAHDLTKEKNILKDLNIKQYFL